MNQNHDFTLWIASASRNWLGDTYVLLYKDAPEWVRDRAVERFGKNTVFLRSERRCPETACAVLHQRSSSLRKRGVLRKMGAVRQWAVMHEGTHPAP